MKTKFRKPQSKKLTKDVLFGKHFRQPVILLLPKNSRFRLDTVAEIRSQLNDAEKQNNLKFLIFQTPSIDEPELSLLYRHNTKQETIELLNKKFNNKLQIIK